MLRRRVRVTCLRKWAEVGDGLVPCSGSEFSALRGLLPS